MKHTPKHLDDLSEIRSIMERSTRFLSLSGWSGIFAGLFALIGATLAFIFIGGSDLSQQALLAHAADKGSISLRLLLLIDAALILFFALVFAIYFSFRKASQKGEKIWSAVTRLLLLHLLVPLITAAMLVLILIMQEQYVYVAPLTLVFYGLSLVSAGKYTNQEIIWLGFVEIILGMSAMIWPAYGLYIWAAGFGLLHLIYGITLYYKYDRKEV